MPPGPSADLQPLAGRHLKFGWWSLAAFGTFGLLLESFHGVKMDAYLNVVNETRRLMWTLAHAHGTLLGLAHVGFATTIRTANLTPGRIGSASSALIGASLLLPGGFFLGGVRFYAGDPGVGIALVPIGAVFFIYGAAAVARALSGRRG